LLRSDGSLHSFYPPARAGRFRAWKARREWRQAAE